MKLEGQLKSGRRTDKKHKKYVLSNKLPSFDFEGTALANSFSINFFCGGCLPAAASWAAARTAAAASSGGAILATPVIARETTGGNHRDADTAKATN